MFLRRTRLGTCGSHCLGIIVALVSAATLPLLACAQDFRAGTTSTIAKSIKITRDDGAFEVAIYTPSTAQNSGTVVFLNGFPGARLETNPSSRTHLLATLLAESGYSSVRFNYAGSWANEGQFSWFGGILDTEAVLAFLRSDTARAFGINGSRIAVVGHSYGGWVALMTAARDPKLRCVAVTEPANMGKSGAVIRDNKDAHRRRIAYYDQVLEGPTAKIHGPSAKVLADNLMDNAVEWDFVNQSEQLKSKQLLFVTAKRVAPTIDDPQPLIDRLRQANPPSIRTAIIEGADHNFTSHGPQLNSVLQNWITMECQF